ncbi:signal peptidase II [Phenylobacterium sp.]|uniref:signal peptidase II n=1 Tax=Phenylobacterium sp. TaxID=1871053 RepID=UPI00301DAF6D
MTEAAAPARGITAWGRRAYAVAAATVILDQLTKYWIVSILALPVGATVEVFWPLQWTRIWNEGVSFGLFQARHDLMRWAMVAFSVVVGVTLAVWARKQTRWLPAVGLGLIVGGALGNAVDRALFGAVIDFIDVSRLGFFPWIFNVADSGITVGVILILLDSFRREPPA